MESTLSSTSSLLTLTKTLNTSTTKPLSNGHHHHRLFRSILHQTLHKRLLSSGRINCINNGGNFQKSVVFVSNCSNLNAISLRKLYLVAPISARLACISNSAANFASSGGGSDGVGGGSNGGGGGGDGGSNGGEIKSKTVAVESEEISALSPDVIILDVSGMTCGGCAASVKRILESQPNVSSASVNLATETAIVWPVTEAKAMQNWQQQIGETLAKHLTNCGFKSNLRGQGAIEGDIA